jgi:predicted Zn-dependent protease
MMFWQRARRGKRDRVQMIRNAIGLLLIVLALLGPSRVAWAQTVEVAPGVQVTRKTYKVPSDEQPFFGFAEKTEEQREADAKFIADITETAGSKEKAFEAAMLRGWQAITANRFGEAAKRFNQAYLLAPEQSGVYHGFAMVVQGRFNDLGYADELFKVARKQPNPLKALNADYGKLLLMENRVADAKPVLEQAVIDKPDLGDAWAYLAFARLKTGDNNGACVAADEATKRRPSASVGRDLIFIKRDAKCH